MLICSDFHFARTTSKSRPLPLTWALLQPVPPLSIIIMSHQRKKGKKNCNIETETVKSQKKKKGKKVHVQVEEDGKR